MILFLASAFAMEPPTRPERTAPIAGECLEAIALDVEWESPCNGILVPPSDLADLLADQSWALHLQDRYRLDVGQLEWQIKWLEAELERSIRPVPFLQRPSTFVFGGVIGGTLSVLGGAWAISQLDQ